jgi:sugar/nucleoside kinase (ribokinase family)
MNVASVKSTTLSPHILVLGHVTRDLIGSKERLGGSASFAAQAVAALGYRATVVTAAPSHVLLRPLLENPCIVLHRKNCSDFTTFVLDYSKPQRRLFLSTQAPPLLPEDIPPAVRKTQVAYVAPVMRECGSAVIENIETDFLVVGAQGWMRKVAEDGLVIPYPAPANAIPRKARVVVFSELDCREPEAFGRNLADRGSIVAITRATKGVTLLAGGKVMDLPCEPVSSEVDPTGAGDVFGVVLGLNLYVGMDLVDAAKSAMWAAARVVEGPGMGNLVSIAGQDGQRRETKVPQ